ncbi:GNAT family N-acetyltransferase [Chloroflexota bacterium]
MTTEIESLIHIQKDLLKPAAQMLARAFYDDPFSAYLFPEQKDRERKLPYMHKNLLRFGMLYGEAYATSDELEGIATWMPPGNFKITLWRGIRCGGISMLLKVGWGALKKLSSYGRHVTPLHRQLDRFNPWYLSILAVDPEFRGKAFVSRLFEPMLKIFDSTDQYCFLETNKERNVPMYEHFGFKMIEKLPIPDTDLTTWMMLREPKAI